MIPLIFCLLSFGALGTDCPKYICNRTSVGKDEMCTFWRYNDLHISPCSDNDLICVLPSGMEDNGICTNKNEVPSALPGDYCTNDEQCLYESKCLGNVCKGMKANDSCILDEHCDVELYCDGAKCKEPQENCTKEGECASNKMCYGGKCVALFSLDNNANSTIPGICKSYYVEDTKCVEGPTLVNKETLNCPNTSSCTYKVLDKEFNKSCICGQTENGSRFCPLEKGDFYVSKV